MNNIISILNKIKQWWNNPCLWSHDYEIVASEKRGLAYKCTKCNKLKIQRF